MDKIIKLDQPIKVEYGSIEETSYYDEIEILRYPNGDFNNLGMLLLNSNDDRDYLVVSVNLDIPMDKSCIALDINKSSVMDSVLDQINNILDLDDSDKILPTNSVGTVPSGFLDYPIINISKVLELAHDTEE